MKIDFKQILNIKNKKDLNKFKLDKPIYLLNYLFHYLILFDKLDIIKLHKFPIYVENEEGLNGFCLAAKSDNIKILTYLIKNYADYIYNTNSNEEMFINFLKPKYIIKLLNLNLDLNILLKHKISLEEDTVLDTILLNYNFKDLQILFKYYKPLEYPLIYLILNNILTENEKIFLLNMFNQNQLNLRDTDDYNLIFGAINIDSEIILKYLLNRNVTADYYTIINTEHPLRTAFSNKNLKLYSIIWNHIKDNYKFESTDKYLQNIAHFLLKLNAFDETSINILSNCPSEVWHQLSIYKITPLELISKYNFEKYNKILINKEVNLSINNLKKKILGEKWYNFFKSLKKYSNNEKVNFENYKYSYGNLFQAKFKDVAIIIIYLKEKYKNLYLPNLDNYSLSNLNYSDNLGLSWPDTLLERTNIFPWIICYENDHTYWIHSYLNNLINLQKLKKEYNFSFVYISIDIPEGGLHANILIYDFINNTIERFDPYGDTVFFDKKLDEILEEELTWNTGFKYLKPSEFMPISGFQTISDELNPLNQKAGDYGGFCLAWCTWYLEHRLKNKKIPPTLLVNKLLKKISKLDITFMEYIRNYANKLNINRIKIFKKSGLNEKEISNLVPNNQNNRILNKFIIDSFILYNK